MATTIGNSLDMGGVARILNLPDGVQAQEPATVAQLNAAVEGLAWKDSARVSTQGNVSLASPGATIDGITMAANDRVLVRAQTTQSENGIYIWNGAAVAMTRSLDASTSAELETAVLNVEEGTNAGTLYRQAAINFVLGSGAVTWTTLGAGAPAASETTAGIAEVATQAEVDAGTDDLRMVTPQKLATWSGRIRKVSQSIGDGSATQFTVTHNLNTRDVQVEVYRNASPWDKVIVDTDLPSVNATRITFAAAPAVNAFHVVVLG